MSKDLLIIKAIFSYVFSKVSPIGFFHIFHICQTLKPLKISEDLDGGY